MDPVKSATRTLEVLDYFATVRDPRPLKDICDALRYPQSSMTVLLKTLTSLGYLNYDRSQRLYFPTPKVATLGEWIPHRMFGDGPALEVLRDVVNATRETVVFAKRNDIYLEYVATIPSPHPLRFEVSVGSVRPVHQSPLGWLLLSTLDDREARALIKRSAAAAAASEGAHDDVDHVLEEVRGARQNGYIYGENTPFLGGATLGVMMPAHGAATALALGCGGVIKRMRAGYPAYLDSIKAILAASLAADPGASLQ